MKKWTIKSLIENISPILINSKKTSITLSMSKRFFIFRLINNLTKRIEEEPYLNFISIIKNYKIMGRTIDGTIEELHRDRNKFYFKKFFLDKKVYELIKRDLEVLYPEYKSLNIIISRHGISILDNYKINHFNILLLTAHAGQWVPKSLENKINYSEKERFKEEDIDSDKIYSKIVLKNGGIWVNTKLSRFVCDFNRPKNNCMYSKETEKWMKKELWQNTLNKKEIDIIHNWHKEFYATITQLLDTYNFNIIFDGHTMKHKQGRPRISIGTKYIPSFYMPIVRSMRKRLKKMDYNPILFNTPYSGGFILKWLKTKFPNRFIFSMEINKREYMNINKSKSFKRKVNKIKNELPKIFEI